VFILKTSTELLKKEIPYNIRKVLFNIFEDSYMVYKDIKGLSIFTGKYSSNIDGRLLSYIIDKHFEEDMLPKGFYFDVLCRTMAFNQKRVELKTNNMILTISRVREKNLLPNKAKYKEHYSKGNQLYEKQLRFNIDNYKIEDIPSYGIITYKASNDGIEFLDIILPNSNYNKIIDRIELKPHLALINTIEEIEEERILSRENLKIKVLDEYRKDSGGI